MCGFKLEIIFLLACGILHASTFLPTKKNVVRVKKYVELKQNLRQGPAILPSTTTAPEIVKNCVCSKVYDPVCGSNDQSYYNLCQLQCRSKSGTIQVVHQGNCIPFKKH